MVVAAVAILLGSGRADVKESEIEREVELLAGELRQRYGFTDPERAAGAELWAEVLERIEAAEIPESTLALWFRPFHSPGLAGGRLWLVATEKPIAGEWAARRYRGLFNEAIEAARPESGIRVGFMALDPREGGRP